MNERKIRIGSKSVYRSEPFVPQQNLATGFVGRMHEQKTIMAAWMAGQGHQPMNPLLVGEPGVGKNRMVYELAQKTKRSLYIFQGHEDVTAEDLACSVRFSDHEGQVMDYVLSPLVTAMYTGGICFIDEIGKIRPRALALLVSVLDERRYIDSILLGERIIASPGFRFIAATNTADINLMPEFILSRLRPVVKVGYPSRTEIDEVVRQQFPAMQREVNDLLDQFWGLWRNYNSPDKNLSPRDALYIFGLASKLASFEMAGGESGLAEASSSKPFTLSEKSAVTGILPGHLSFAFDKFFGQNTA